MFEIKPFQIFGADHLSVLFFILSLSILIPYFLRNQSESVKTKFGQGLAVLLITNELLKPFIYSSIWPEDFPFLKMLPMHFCHLASFSAAIYMLTRKRIFFEIAFFWGIGGGLMANTQPDVKFDFPHLHFLLFFISHGLMWLGIGFISIGLNNRPTLKSITDVLKVTFPVLFLVYLINVIINFFAEGEPANYWFMMQRPAGQSIVDLMPDPPFHYIFFIILGVAMFYIIYSPFYLRDKLK